MMVLEDEKREKYQHFRSGNFYEVLGSAIDTETLNEMVVYKALYESEKYGKDSIWVRPTKMFHEMVLHNGQMVPRFKLVIT